MQSWLSLYEVDESVDDCELSIYDEDDVDDES